MCIIAVKRAILGLSCACPREGHFRANSTEYLGFSYILRSGVACFQTCVFTEIMWVFPHFMEGAFLVQMDGFDQKPRVFATFHAMQNPVPRMSCKSTVSSPMTPCCVFGCPFALFLSFSLSLSRVFCLSFCGLSCSFARSLVLSSAARNSGSKVVDLYNYRLPFLFQWHVAPWPNG